MLISTTHHICNLPGKSYNSRLCIIAALFILQLSFAANTNHLTTLIRICFKNTYDSTFVTAFWFFLPKNLMNSLNSLVACPGCDLLLKKIEPTGGTKLFCPRCNTLLSQKKHNSISKVLAVSISGLITYIPAIFLPLLTLNAIGIKQEGSVFDAFLSFYYQKYYFVAVLLFLTSIFFPLIKLSLLFCVSLQVKIRLYSRNLPFLFRLSHYLDEWGMPDVYLIAVLVSIIKISSVASIQYDIGFFCFIFLVIVTRASSSVLDSETFWQEIEKIKPSRPPQENSGN